MMSCSSFLSTLEVLLYSSILIQTVYQALLESPKLPLLSVVSPISRLHEETIQQTSMFCLAFPKYEAFLYHQYF